MRLNGYDSEAELLAAVRDIAHEWYVDPARRALFVQQLERDGQVTGFESEVWRHKTRERIWVSENAHVVHDAAGQVLFFEGTLEEITDRVRERQALRRSQQQLQQVFELVPGVLYHWAMPHSGPALTASISPRVNRVA